MSNTIEDLNTSDLLKVSDELKNEAYYYELGRRYLYGIDIEINPNLGFKYLKKANDLLQAHKGDFDYVYPELGDCYFYGYGTKKNIAEAIKYYSKDPFCLSQLKLYRMYRFGYLVEKNYERAKYYLEYYLGDAMLGGDRENKLAIQFIENLDLADFYYYGLGIEKNHKEALRLYINGFIGFICDYIDIFLEGFTTPKYKKAWELYDRLKAFIPTLGELINPISIDYSAEEYLRLGYNVLGDAYDADNMFTNAYFKRAMERGSIVGAMRYYRTGKSYNRDSFSSLDPLYDFIVNRIYSLIEEYEINDKEKLNEIKSLVVELKKCLYN